MSTQTGREEFGETSVGLVVVLTFAGTPDDNGQPTRREFQVRHGVRTVGSFDNQRDAQACARTLVKAN